MKTISSIVLILIAWFIASYAAWFVLDIVGMPGALLAGKPEGRSKGRFYLASFVCFLGHAYVWLGYTAFVVNWTHLAAARPDVIGWLLWPFAFLAVTRPITVNRSIAANEAKESGIVQHPQVEGLFITELMTYLLFFVFAFFPVVARTLYGYLPFMRR